MFTIGAVIAMIVIGWLAHRKNEQDRPMYDRAISEDRVWLLVLHIRQDLKLIAFGLGAILIMLGVIADRTG
jgi:hypothetical protein